MVDWNLAAKVAEGVAGLQPAGDPEPFQALVRPADEAEALVSAYTGLVPSAGVLPVAESIDRKTWIDANLASIRGVLEPAAAKAAEGAGPLGGVAGAAAGAVLGLQAGAISGFLAGRVHGPVRVPGARPRRAGAAAVRGAEPRPRGDASSTPTPTACCAGSRCTRSRTRCSSAACRGCGRTWPAWCAI